MYNLKTYYNNNNNYINNNNNSNNKKNKLVINSTSKKLDDFDDINQTQVSELLKIIKDIQSIDEHNINDDSKSSSSDLSDHSSSLTLNSKKRTSDHKKGSKNKLKQLSSSPTDTPISAPNEINNSTLAALKNDSETNENMRSSIDSSLSDDSLMNEIEYDFKKLISKLDENNDLKRDEEKVEMKNLTNEEEEEEETDQIFEFDEEFEVIIKTSNETAAATTTTTTNKRLSLSPIEEISTASEKSLSPYLHLNEIPVFYKPDYIKNFNLTKSQYKLIFEFYNTYSVSDNLSNNLVRLAMLECSKIRNDFKATEDDINRIIRIADTNKDEHLNFDQFIELLCLFFSNELNLNSILLAILNNNASNHETKGCLNAKEANQFITYVNLFYGRQFNFMIFNRSVSYDQIASQLGEDLAAFTYF